MKIKGNISYTALLEYYRAHAGMVNAGKSAALLQEAYGANNTIYLDAVAHFEDARIRFNKAIERVKKEDNGN